MGHLNSDITPRIEASRVLRKYVRSNVTLLVVWDVLFFVVSREYRNDQLGKPTAQAIIECEAVFSGGSHCRLKDLQQGCMVNSRPVVCKSCVCICRFPKDLEMPIRLLVVCNELYVPLGFVQGGRRTPSSSG